jgi:DNA-binding transcriptional regulator YdaS (Cro superfamily)
MKKNAALLKIVKRVGSITELAEILGVSRPHVGNWVYGRRKIPPRLVKKLVSLSGGEVTPEDLRPDIF